MSLAITKKILKIFIYVILFIFFYYFALANNLTNNPINATLILSLINDEQNNTFFIPAIAFPIEDKELGKVVVFIYGNRIEGDIAALKEFISARDVFLSDNAYSNFDNVKTRKLVILDDYDVSALGVMDLMHNEENVGYFLKKDGSDGDKFADVVTDILNDNNFEISIKTVKTTSGTSYGENTTLRLKHSNSDYSPDYKDAIVNNQKPVVLSRGLWSNLFTWQDFAKELASEGRDSWLIELTGGPTQDCDTCPNYDYEDLVDYYWPALISGVEYYSGQNAIDYIGFSNGCRVALDSLKNWSSSGKNNAGYCFNTETGFYDVECDLASNPVDTFVGVGCPGAFVNESLYSNCWKKYATQLRQKLSSKTHLSAGDMGSKLLAVAPITDIQCKSAGLLSSFSGGSISYNLADKYLNFIESDSDSQPGNNINVNRFILIRGTVPVPYGNIFGIPLIYFTKTDLVVTKEDEDIIYSNVNSNQKFYYLSTGAHVAPVSLLSLADSFITKSIITDLVNGQNRTNYEFLLLNKTG